MDNPNPVGIQYPRTGQMYMLGEIQRLSAHVVGLVDTLVIKDMRIAQQEGEIEALRKMVDASNAEKQAQVVAAAPPPAEAPAPLIEPPPPPAEAPAS